MNEPQMSLDLSTNILTITVDLNTTPKFTKTRRHKAVCSTHGIQFLGRYGVDLIVYDDSSLVEDSD